MIASSLMTTLNIAYPNLNIPGLDYSVGTPLPTSSLKSVTSLPTSGAGITYDAVNHVVRITQDGANLNGYNLSGVRVMVMANNVTIQNCLFTASANINTSITQLAPYSGTTVQYNTFDGQKLNSLVYTDFISSSSGTININHNSFVNSPADMIAITGGSVTDNYFSGGGYATGAHADAIWVPSTTAPVVISGNYIDWRNQSGAQEPTDNAVRITPEQGNISNVTVTNNVLLGGNWTIYASNEPEGTKTLGTISNVNISNNYVGFGIYGDVTTSYLPTNYTYQNNTDVDYKASAMADAAWSVYDASLSPSQTVLAATATSYKLTATKTNTVLYGGDVAHAWLYGGPAGTTTILIPGTGRDYLYSGAGKDVFTFLSIAKSPAGGTTYDAISGFKQGTDVIDLSAIDKTLTSTMTFIGTGSFDGAANELNYSYNASTNTTTVEAALAGSTNPVFRVDLTGKVALKASDFKL